MHDADERGSRSPSSPSRRSPPAARTARCPGHGLQDRDDHAARAEPHTDSLTVDLARREHVDPPQAAAPARAEAQQAARHVQDPALADSIDKVLGQKLAGSAQYVVGRADSSINRLTFIDCRYGVIRAKAPTVEIRVSLYRTEGDAADRIAPPSRTSRPTAPR